MNSGVKTTVSDQDRNSTPRPKSMMKTPASMGFRT